MEDVTWLKTNRRRDAASNSAASAALDDASVLVSCKEHCLVGLKGSVRRASDGHLIHANVDTDVIVAEEPPMGGTEKPEVRDRSAGQQSATRALAGSASQSGRGL